MIEAGYRVTPSHLLRGGLRPGKPRRHFLAHLARGGTERQTPAPARTPLSRIELTNVSKTFARGIRAVNDFSLEVADGELCAMVGPSGSGKSTVLRMIAGLESPTSGDISIGGKLVHRTAPNERGVAMVFQESALYPFLSVRGNLEYGLKKQRLGEDELRERVAEAARFLGIEPLLSRRPHELSGGEAQRVALGRALVHRPQAFLLDEPLSNLDAALRAQLRREIAALHKRLGVAMLCVTHDQAEAMTLAERLVVMRDGRIEQQGAPEEIYNRPVNTFVAQFIGEPAMNLFQGEARSGRFTLNANASWPAEKVDEGPVMLGVRPEDLLSRTGDAPEFAVAQVESLERLGHESHVRSSVAGQPCIVRLPSSSLPNASTLSLTIRPGAEHWFASDGRRLGGGQPSFV